MTRRSAIAMALAALALVMPASAATAAPASGTMTERLVATEAPDADRVTETFVRIYDPLPASVGEHPAACDWISYLRFRHPEGPQRATDADAVAVIIPGFLGGAASFDQVARNTVRRTAAAGGFVEFWALDRRSNCLEDHAGVRTAARARNPGLAYDYYWGFDEIHGERFDGFAAGADAAFLKHFGLERTLRDWYTVIRRGFPRPRMRRQKVICGGHSLGGPLTAAFAGWDFDGDPATRADAGFNQCAAFAGLDTRLSLGLPGGGEGGVNPIALLLGASEAIGSPYMNVSPLTPETFQIPPIFGVGAFYAPQGTDLLPGLPHSVNIDLAQRLLFSRDAVNFATGIPGIRDFTLTNATVLAGVFDDNSAPLSFLRSSVGFMTGGPLVEKDFPTPGDGTFALPAEPSTPLYSWTSYRNIGRPGSPVALNDAGLPYTDSESEVSNLAQLARAMFEAPADFIEQYFPTALLSDVDAAGSGNRDGALAALRYDGITRRPAILIQAGDSDDNSAADVGPPRRGEPPNDRPLSRTWTLPGYNHLDVLTAARHQNDGRPEPSSANLADFMLDVVDAD